MICIIASNSSGFMIGLTRGVLLHSCYWIDSEIIEYPSQQPFNISVYILLCHFYISLAGMDLGHRERWE